MSKLDDTEVAIQEATRFIAKASEARDYMRAQKSSYFGPSPLVAAMKRASMDLTRSLAKLRKAS